jgi:integrase
MKGSTRKRGNTWTAYWFTTDPGTGKRKQHTKGGFRTQRAAQEHLNDTLGKVQTGTWAPDKKLTVKELLTDWLAAKKSQGLAPTTLAQYRNVVDSWLVPKIGALELRHLSPARAQELAETLRANGSVLNRGGLSPRSVQLALTVLKASTAWSFETGLVGRDPLAGYRRPRAQSNGVSGDAWTAEEAKTFLAHVANDRLAVAWALLLTRGLRRGELAGLRWDAVDLDNATMRIVHTRVLVDGKPVPSTPKTEPGRRNVPLDPALVGMLRAWKARQGEERLSVGEGWGQGGHVFTDEIGRPIHPAYFSKALDSLAKAAGLRRIRLHDLRHTAASLMIAAGENVKVVAELLGHSSPTITQTIYQHVMPGMSEAAGERLSAALLG